VILSLNLATVNIKLLIKIRKIYNNNKKKYSRKKYDFLNIKLQIFYNCCTVIRLLNTEYAKTFSCILKRHASLFYYNKITGRDYDFKIMLVQIREHFKIKKDY
jgi:hypothetical protein